MKSFQASLSSCATLAKLPQSFVYCFLVRFFMVIPVITVCNRGTRDLHPPHYRLSLPHDSVESWGPTDSSDIELSVQKDKEEDENASDSSSGSVRNFQQTDNKRRRTSGAADTSEGLGDGGGPPSSSHNKQRKTRKVKACIQSPEVIEEMKRRIYADFWNGLNLVQDPVTVSQFPSSLCAMCISFMIELQNPVMSLFRCCLQ